MNDNKSLRDTRPSLPSLVPRQYVGRYEIIYPVGQGGMASVYAARLSGMAGFEKLFAVKVIHQHLSEDESYINMFLDEARLAAGIQHPNVAEIFEVGHDEGVLYMVGEFVHGQSLRTFYSRAASIGMDISQPVAAYVISRVCQGLQAAHEHRGIDEQPLNLVHRDISPSNILISYDGFIKVIDFGVAYAQGRLQETVAGTIKGKLGFLPPEQIRGATLDRRADLFSLGVVLYIMATGTAPFRSTTEAEQIYKVLNGRFPLPREANPSVHPMLERIILTAMALRREDRYPTADDMRKDLVRFIRKAGAQVGGESLSKLMRSLFAEDLLRHKELVKEFRSRRRTQGRRPGEPEDPTPSPLPNEQSPLRVSRLQPGQRPTTEVVSRTPNPFVKLSGKARALAKTQKMSPLSRSIGFFTLALFSALLAFFAVTVASKFLEPVGRKAAKNLVQLPIRWIQNAQPRSLASLGLSDAWSTATQPAPRVIPTAKNVRITLDLRPKSARVRLDGQLYPQGTTLLKVEADGSSRGLEVTAPGHQPMMQWFLADKDQSISAILEPEAPDPTPANVVEKGKRKRATPPVRKQPEVPTKKEVPSKKGIDIPIRKSPYDN